MILALVTVFSMMKEIIWPQIIPVTSVAVAATQVLEKNLSLGVQISLSVRCLSGS